MKNLCDNEECSSYNNCNKTYTSCEFQDEMRNFINNQVINNANK